MRTKLDALHVEQGFKYTVYYPWDTPPRVLRATGSSRLAKSPQGPSKFEWEFVDAASGKTAWLPGWYLAMPLKPNVLELKRSS